MSPLLPANFRHQLAGLHELRGDVFRQGVLQMNRMLDGARMRALNLPLLGPSELAGRSVLVTRPHNAGLGEDILSAIVAANVRDAARRLVLEADPRLFPLYRRSPAMAGIEAVKMGAPLPSGLDGRCKPVDIAAMGSGLLPEPLLIADPDMVRDFRDRLSGGRPVVGLAWRGYGENAAARSIPLEQLRRLLTLPVDFVSVQHGDVAAEIEAHGLGRLRAEAFDPLDTDTLASVLSACDVVVTVDNSVAHLAPALGVPTLVLLPFEHDWRWVADREGRWLFAPSALLVRQRRAGDWSCPVADACSLLGKESD